MATHLAHNEKSQVRILGPQQRAIVKATGQASYLATTGSIPVSSTLGDLCMTLPELPKKYERKEAKIDGLVADWFDKNYPRSVILEVKVEGGRLLEHQRRLINKVSKTGKFKYKFPDGGKRTPLDYVVLKDIDAVLAECVGRKCVCTINNDHQINIRI